jgi:hypothetical protein
MSPAHAASTGDPVPAPDARAIADAYVYLLGRMLCIRQEHMDRKTPAFTYNQMKYHPLGAADFVNPNFDVAYLEAWIGLDDHTAAILEIPEVRGRYYTVQILDEWGEVITNINERTFPSRPFGKFAVVTPGSTGHVPPDAGRIDLHSRKAKLLGRVELKDDPEEAVRLQKLFTIKAHGKPVIKPPPMIPMFDNQSLLGVEIFDEVDERLTSALDVAPNAAEMQQMVRWVAAYAHSSKAARAQVDRLLRDKVVPEFRESALVKSAPYRNQWAGGAQTGNYGKDFRLRTCVNYAGIWANSSDEVIYLVATRDADEKPLNGSNSYLLEFPPDKLPQSVVDSHWSVILVGVPDFRVAENPLQRYNFNSYSSLQKEPDGSLRIAVGPEAIPGVPESNWLPAPVGKPFSLTFRTYVPKDVVKRGEWSPPPLTLQH